MINDNIGRLEYSQSGMNPDPVVQDHGPTAWQAAWICVAWFCHRRRFTTGASGFPEIHAGQGLAAEMAETDTVETGLTGLPFPSLPERPTREFDKPTVLQHGMWIQLNPGEDRSLIRPTRPAAEADPDL